MVHRLHHPFIELTLNSPRKPMGPRELVALSIYMANYSLLKWLEFPKQLACRALNSVLGMLS